MNQKKIAKKVLPIFIISIALLFFGKVGYEGYKITLSWLNKNFMPKSIIVKYENIYSDISKKELRGFLDDTLPLLGRFDFNKEQLFKKLKKRFRFVKSVSWEWGFFDKAVVVIHGVLPRFVVNNCLILGNKKRLFPLDLFPEVSKDSLRPVRINKDLFRKTKRLSFKVPVNIYKFLDRVPSSYWEAYSVNYSDKFRILLQKRDRVNKLVRVVDEKTFFDEKKLAIAEAIYNNKKFMRNRHVVCDLRFKDRICAKLVRM